MDAKNKGANVMTDLRELSDAKINEEIKRLTRLIDGNAEEQQRLFRENEREMANLDSLLAERAHRNQTGEVVRD